MLASITLLVAVAGGAQPMPIGELASLYQPYLDCLEKQRNTINIDDSDAWQKAEALDEECRCEPIEAEVRTRLRAINPDMSEDRLERAMDRFLNFLIMVNMDLTELAEPLEEDRSE